MTGRRIKVMASGPFRAWYAGPHVGITIEQQEVDRHEILRWKPVVTVKDGDLTFSSANAKMGAEREWETWDAFLKEARDLSRVYATMES